MNGTAIAVIMITINCPVVATVRLDRSQGNECCAHVGRSQTAGD